MIEKITCKITGKIFFEPVLLSSKKIVEKEVILKELKEAKEENRSPICPITHEVLIGTGEIAKKIKWLTADFLKLCPKAKDDQYVPSYIDKYKPIGEKHEKQIVTFEQFIRKLK